MKRWFVLLARAAAVVIGVAGLRYASAGTLTITTTGIETGQTIEASHLTTAFGDITTWANGGIGGDNITANSIENGDIKAGTITSTAISASAGIDYSMLDSVTTAGNIIVGNASKVLAEATLNGPHVTLGWSYASITGFPTIGGDVTIGWSYTTLNNSVAFQTPQPTPPSTGTPLAGSMWGFKLGTAPAYTTVTDDVDWTAFKLSGVTGLAPIPSGPVLALVYVEAKAGSTYNPDTQGSVYVSLRPTGTSWTNAGAQAPRVVAVGPPIDSTFGTTTHYAYNSAVIIVPTDSSSDHSFDYDVQVTNTVSVKIGVLGYIGPYPQ